MKRARTTLTASCCGRPIRAGARYLVIGEGIWHQKCWSAVEDSTVFDIRSGR